VRIDSRPAKRPIFLAVHRLEDSVYYKRLDPAAFRLLLALRDGRSLAAACDRAFRGAKGASAADAGKVREWFATWTRFGWLC
jgi:hypothetical protein